MEKLTMCRICLVKDVEMYVVDNENMQKIYEELTDIPFVTDDRRPMLACDFCYAQLNQCCQLVSKCLEAEEVFAQMLNEGCKQNPSGFKGNLEFSGGLFKTPIPMTIDEVCQKESGANTAQEPAVSDIEDNIVVKKEYPSEIVGSSAIKEQLPAVCDTEDNIIIKKEFPSENVQSAEQVLAVCDIENNIEIRKECPSETAESGTTAEQEPAVCDMEDDIVVKKVYPSEIVGSNAITEQLPAVCDIEDDNEIKNTEQLPSVCGIEDNIVVKKEYPDPKITEQEPAVCDIEGDIEIKKEIEIAESSPVTEQLPSVCGIGDNIKIKEEYTSENSAITEQGELPAVCDLKDDIDFEEEYPSDELGAQAFTLPLVFEPDTEECLMNLQSVKKEQDVPEETSNLPSQHDFCSPVLSEELKYNPNNDTWEKVVNKTQHYHVKGLPIDKGGRPKKIENFSSQVYEANQKYMWSLPEANKRAVACHTAKYRDRSHSQLLQGYNEVEIPVIPSVCYKTYTHKSAAPTVKAFRPKYAASPQLAVPLDISITDTAEQNAPSVKFKTYTHKSAASSVSYAPKSVFTVSSSHDTAQTQKDFTFYPSDSSRKRETPETIRKYNREKKRLSRNKEDFKIHLPKPVASTTCTPKQATPTVRPINYTPKSADDDTVLNEEDLIFYPSDPSRKQEMPETPEDITNNINKKNPYHMDNFLYIRKRTEEELKEYNRERRRLSRNNEDLRTRERIRDREAKRIKRSQRSAEEIEIDRARNTARRRAARMRAVGSEDKRVRNTARRRANAKSPHTVDEKPTSDTIDQSLHTENEERTSDTIDDQSTLPKS